MAITDLPVLRYNNDTRSELTQQIPYYNNKKYFLKAVCNKKLKKNNT